MKRIIICLALLSLIILSGCIIEEDTYVGKVKEIKMISSGGFGKTDKALVILDNDRELIICNGIEYLEVGAEIWTANFYTCPHQVKH